MAATGSSVGGEPTNDSGSHDSAGCRPGRVGTRRSLFEKRRSRRPSIVSESLSRTPRLLIKRPSAPRSRHTCTSASSPKLVSTITARSRVDSLFRSRRSTVTAGRSGTVLSNRTPGRHVSAKFKAVRPSLTSSTAHPLDSRADRYIVPRAASGSAMRTLWATLARAPFPAAPGSPSRTAVRRSDGPRRRSTIVGFRAQSGTFAPRI